MIDPNQPLLMQQAQEMSIPSTGPVYQAPVTSIPMASSAAQPLQIGPSVDSLALNQSMQQLNSKLDKLVNVMTMSMSNTYGTVSGVLTPANPFYAQNAGMGLGPYNPLSYYGSLYDAPLYSKTAFNITPTEYNKAINLRLDENIRDAGASIIGMGVGGFAGRYAGAALGSLLGPVGTAVGALGGEFLGATLGGTIGTGMVRLSDAISGLSDVKDLRPYLTSIIAPNKNGPIMKLKDLERYYKQIEDVAADMAEIIPKDVVKKDLLPLLNQYDLVGMVRDTKEFKKKFKDLVETVKEVGGALHMSLEDATKLMGEYKKLGITDINFTSDLAYRTKFIGEQVGMNPQAMAQQNVQYATALRQTGMSGKSAAATTALGQALFSNYAMTQEGNQIIEQLGGRQIAVEKFMSGFTGMMSNMLQGNVGSANSLPLSAMAAFLEYDKEKGKYSFNKQAFARFNQQLEQANTPEERMKLYTNYSAIGAANASSMGITSNQALTSILTQTASPDIVSNVLSAGMRDQIYQAWLPYKDKLSFKDFSVNYLMNQYGMDYETAVMMASSLSRSNMINANRTLMQSERRKEADQYQYLLKKYGFWGRLGTSASKFWSDLKSGVRQGSLKLGENMADIFRKIPIFGGGADLERYETLTPEQKEALKQEIGSMNFMEIDKILNTQGTSLKTPEGKVIIPGETGNVTLGERFTDIAAGVGEDLMNLVDARTRAIAQIGTSSDKQTNAYINAYKATVSKRNTFVGDNTTLTLSKYKRNILEAGKYGTALVAAQNNIASSMDLKQAEDIIKQIATGQTVTGTQPATIETVPNDINKIPGFLASNTEIFGTRVIKNFNSIIDDLQNKLTPAAKNGDFEEVARISKQIAVKLNNAINIANEDVIDEKGRQAIIKITKEIRDYIKLNTEDVKQKVAGFEIVQPKSALSQPVSKQIFNKNLQRYQQQLAEVVGAEQLDTKKLKNILEQGNSIVQQSNLIAPSNKELVGTALEQLSKMELPADLKEQVTEQKIFAGAKITKEEFDAITNKIKQDISKVNDWVNTITANNYIPKKEDAQTANSFIALLTKDEALLEKIKDSGFDTSKIKTQLTETKNKLKDVISKIHDKIDSMKSDLETVDKQIEGINKNIDNALKQTGMSQAGRELATEYGTVGKEFTSKFRNIEKNLITDKDKEKYAKIENLITTLEDQNATVEQKAGAINEIVKIAAGMSDTARKDEILSIIQPYQDIYNQKAKTSKKYAAFNALFNIRDKSTLLVANKELKANGLEEFANVASFAYQQMNSNLVPENIQKQIDSVIGALEKGTRGGITHGVQTLQEIKGQLPKELQDEVDRIIKNKYKLSSETGKNLIKEFKEKYETYKGRDETSQFNIIKDEFNQIQDFLDKHKDEIGTEEFDELMTEKLSDMLTTLKVDPSKIDMKKLKEEIMKKYQEMESVKSDIISSGTIDSLKDVLNTRKDDLTKTDKRISKIKDLATQLQKGNLSLGDYADKLEQLESLYTEVSKDILKDNSKDAKNIATKTINRVKEIIKNPGELDLSAYEDLINHAEEYLENGNYDTLNKEIKEALTKLKEDFVDTQKIEDKKQREEAQKKLKEIEANLKLLGTESSQLQNISTPDGMISKIDELTEFLSANKEDLSKKQEDLNKVAKTIDLEQIKEEVKKYQEIVSTGNVEEIQKAGKELFETIQTATEKAAKITDESVRKDILSRLKDMGSVIDKSLDTQTETLKDKIYELDTTIAKASKPVDISEYTVETIEQLQKNLDTFVKAISDEDKQKSAAKLLGSVLNLENISKETGIDVETQEKIKQLLKTAKKKLLEQGFSPSSKLVKDIDAKLANLGSGTLSDEDKKNLIKQIGLDIQTINQFFVDNAEGLKNFPEQYKEILLKFVDTIDNDINILNKLEETDKTAEFKQKLQKLKQQINVIISTKKTNKELDKLLEEVDTTLDVTSKNAEKLKQPPSTPEMKSIQALAKQINEGNLTPADKKDLQNKIEDLFNQVQSQSNKAIRTYELGALEDLISSAKTTGIDVSATEKKIAEFKKQEKENSRKEVLKQYEKPLKEGITNNIKEAYAILNKDVLSDEDFNRLIQIMGDIGKAFNAANKIGIMDDFKSLKDEFQSLTEKIANRQNEAMKEAYSFNKNLGVEGTIMSKFVEKLNDYNAKIQKNDVNIMMLGNTGLAYFVNEQSGTKTFAVTGLNDELMMKYKDVYANAIPELLRSVATYNDTIQGIPNLQIDYSTKSVSDIMEITNKISQIPKAIKNLKLMNDEAGQKNLSAVDKLMALEAEVQAMGMSIPGLDVSDFKKEIEIAKKLLATGDSAKIKEAESKLDSLQKNITSIINNIYERFYDQNGQLKPQTDKLSKQASQAIVTTNKEFIMAEEKYENDVIKAALNVANISTQQVSWTETLSPTAKVQLKEEEKEKTNQYINTKLNFMALGSITQSGLINQLGSNATETAINEIKGLSQDVQKIAESIDQTAMDKLAKISTSFATVDTNLIKEVNYAQGDLDSVINYTKKTAKKLIETLNSDEYKNKKGVKEFVSKLEGYLDKLDSYEEEYKNAKTPEQAKAVFNKIKEEFNIIQTSIKSFSLSSVKDYQKYKTGALEQAAEAARYVAKNEVIETTEKEVTPQIIKELASKFNISENEAEYIVANAEYDEKGNLKGSFLDNLKAIIGINITKEDELKTIMRRKRKDVQEAQENIRDAYASSNKDTLNKLLGFMSEDQRKQVIEQIQTGKINSVESLQKTLKDMGISYENMNKYFTEGAGKELGSIFAEKGLDMSSFETVTATIFGGVKGLTEKGAITPVISRGSVKILEDLKNKTNKLLTTAENYANKAFRNVMIDLKKGSDFWGKNVFNPIQVSGLQKFLEENEEDFNRISYLIAKAYGESETYGDFINKLKETFGIDEEVARGLAKLALGREAAQEITKINPGEQESIKIKGNENLKVSKDLLATSELATSLGPKLSKLLSKQDSYKMVEMMRQISNVAETIETPEKRIAFEHFAAAPSSIFSVENLQELQDLLKSEVEVYKKGGLNLPIQMYSALEKLGEGNITDLGEAKALFAKLGVENVDEMAAKYIDLIKKNASSEDITTLLQNAFANAYGSRLDEVARNGYIGESAETGQVNAGTVASMIIHGDNQLENEVAESEIPDYKSMLDSTTQLLNSMDENTKVTTQLINAVKEYTDKVDKLINEQTTSNSKNKKKAPTD